MAVDTGREPPKERECKTVGEYIRVRGQSVKLGTCEDLFYVRYLTLRGLVESGLAEEDAPANLPPHEYLDPAGGWRYRFPHPSEDGHTWHHDDGYDYGYDVLAPPAVVRLFDHHHAHATIQAKGKERAWQRIGITVPCPQAELTDSAYGELQIMAQKQVEGRLWVIVRCPYCNAMARLPRDEAQALADYNAQGASADPETEETLRRMMEGYEAPAAPPRPWKLVHARERAEENGGGQ